MCPYSNEISTNSDSPSPVKALTTRIAAKNVCSISAEGSYTDNDTAILCNYYTGCALIVKGAPLIGIAPGVNSIIEAEDKNSFLIQ